MGLVMSFQAFARIASVIVLVLQVRCFQRSVFCWKNVYSTQKIRNTVPPEDIDSFPAFLPRGFHASMTRYSRTQPRLYLGKPEDAIRPTAAAFWMRYYLGKEDASSCSSRQSMLECSASISTFSLQRSIWLSRSSMSGSCQLRDCVYYMHSRLPRRTRHQGFANDLTSCPRIMQTTGKTKCERLEWLWNPLRLKETGVIQLYLYCCHNIIRICLFICAARFVAGSYKNRVNSDRWMT